MIEPATITLTAYIGCDFLMQFRAQDDAEVDFDLTGWSVAAQVRKNNGELVLDLEPTIQGSIIDINIARTTLDDCPQGNFAWDLVLITPDSQRLIPFAQGPFIIRQAKSLP